MWKLVSDTMIQSVKKKFLITDNDENISIDVTKVFETHRYWFQSQNILMKPYLMVP